MIIYLTMRNYRIKGRAYVSFFIWIKGYLATGLESIVFPGSVLTEIGTRGIKEPASIIKKGFSNYNFFTCKIGCKKALFFRETTAYFTCKTPGWWNYLFDIILRHLSVSIHKYGYIRQPIHPHRLRYASCDIVQRLCLSRAPCRCGGSAASVCHRIYELRHLSGYFRLVMSE